MTVPEVLISGDHAKIEEWQKAQSLQRTAERRQDLLDQSGSDSARFE
jgi:tRNA (guanine37-N1)-methyltransferase